MKRTSSSEQISSKRLRHWECSHVVKTFSTKVDYPTDSLIIGSDFQIPVHGVFLGTKSPSLQAILLQPSNQHSSTTIENLWFLDKSITQTAAIEFTKHFYPEMSPNLRSLKCEDLHPFLTLVIAHIGEDDKQKIYKSLKRDMTRLLAIHEVMPEQDAAKILQYCKLARQFQISGLAPTFWHAAFWGIRYSFDISFNDFIYFAPPNLEIDHEELPIVMFIALKNGVKWEDVPLRIRSRVKFKKVDMHGFYRRFQRLKTNNQFPELQTLRMFEHIVSQIFSK